MLQSPGPAFAFLFSYIWHTWLLWNYIPVTKLLTWVFFVMIVKYHHPAKGGCSTVLLLDLWEGSDWHLNYTYLVTELHTVRCCSDSDHVFFPYAVSLYNREVFALGWTERKKNILAVMLFAKFHNDLIAPAEMTPAVDRGYVCPQVTSGHVGSFPNYEKVFLSHEDRFLLSWSQSGQERLCSTLPKRDKY